MVRTEAWRRHDACMLQGMKDGITRERRNIERACETWDWARTAGVSAEELRKALMAALQANAAARDDSPLASD